MLGKDSFCITQDFVKFTRLFSINSGKLQVGEVLVNLNDYQAKYVFVFQVSLEAVTSFTRVTAQVSTLMPPRMQ